MTRGRQQREVGRVAMQEAVAKRLRHMGQSQLADPARAVRKRQQGLVDGTGSVEYLDHDPPGLGRVHVGRLHVLEARHKAPDLGEWSIPGGAVELGESIEQALRREIREETGLDIEPDALTGVYKNMPRGIVALVFRCKITGGQLVTNDEVTAFRWADQTEIRQLTSEAYAVRLLDALCEDAAPAIRQHDGTKLLG